MPSQEAQFYLIADIKDPIFPRISPTLNFPVQLSPGLTYVLVPGMLVGGLLVGLTTGWDWKGPLLGAVVGGVPAPLTFALARRAGAWLLLKLQHHPRRG